MKNNKATSQSELVFNNEVITRFELYNSLFLTLPFYKIKDTGTLLPLFIKTSEEGVALGKKPSQIFGDFFDKYHSGQPQEENIDLLFKFIQYIERQVVLFDAVEDAAFNKINPAGEATSLRAIFNKYSHLDAENMGRLLEDFSLRLVLTAHPTQFYPGTVLGIITDLTDAIKTNDLQNIHQLLQQLGKTPFFNKKSPSVVDEAVNLAWYLENVFYFSAANIQTDINQVLSEYGIDLNKNIEMGFWPGGDRDGNPNVKTESTVKVTQMLRQILFRCYYRDFKNLKRRITFNGLEKPLQEIQNLLYQNAFDNQIIEKDISGVLIENLNELKSILTDKHGDLFVDLVNDLIQKVSLFGSHFASLDIRQDSRVLRSAHAFCRSKSPLNSLFPQNYNDLTEQEKIEHRVLKSVKVVCETELDPLIADTLQTIEALKDIQQKNGVMACHRFIISNCQQASDILQLMELFLWNGWSVENLTIDFVPLFETINDLEASANVMTMLYEHPFYKKHLQSRGNKQDIMVGFSDSTKDGGYLMANLAIFKAKVALSEVAQKYNVKLAFFDGRGGPPSRGGGKTHRFYASMGKEIANKNIQLTIQGQTISSQYGSIDNASFNIKQLINAAVSSAFKEKHNILLDEPNQTMLQGMANDSYEAYLNLRQHPLFLNYLETLSPLLLLSKINISSRPVKRNATQKLKLEDLRAIGFVTSWSQLKQNVPGFYGMGTALKNQELAGNWENLCLAYQKSGYFKTIIDNCVMSMSKTDFG
ncbi:MAG: phosphoenolpyruvate carboxylase, partial [Sphingobacteriaceae bacterium]|nr:phosphoenolpyruvate carboxylase [Sphingobacteriaceae bacterium]